MVIPNQVANHDGLAAVNGVLAALAREPSISTGPFESAIARILEAGSRTLGVARANAWLFNEDSTRLRCIISYDARSDQHNREPDLHRDRIPAYFRAIRESRVLAADDVAANPSTVELMSDYLPAHGISSMLDAPILSRGEPAGVICFEHTGPPRHWSEIDKQLVGSLADFAALALAADRQRATEAELGARDDMLELAMASSGDLVLTMTREGIIKYMSQPRGTFADLGRSVGHSWREYVYPEDQARVTTLVRGLIASGKEGATTYRVQTPDGELRWHEAHVAMIEPKGGEPLVAVVSRDVTERRRAEENQRRLEQELLQAQRLETVGRLAGGIAHDFNNLLTVISGSIDLALAAKDQGASRRRLHDAAEAARRAARLTRQLLAFGRKQALERTGVRAHELLGDLADILTRLIRENIRLEFEVDESLPPTHADRAQLEQVIMNLAVNASDAMPDGGVLRFEADAFHTVAGEVRAGIELPEPGHWLRIRVRDTGTGIDPDVLPHIFEPFFTTKPAEYGSGLGLSVSHGIVQQHGGWMAVDSEPGRGTCFEVVLPVLDAPVEAGETLDADERAAPRSGSAHVLVVEDEPVVLNLLCEVLRDLGYTVTAAASPNEALELARASETAFDLVITDIVMPEYDGIQLFERIRSLHPNIRVLYVTGYTNLEVDGVDPESFLFKPFDLATLGRRVASVLGARSLA